MEMNVMMNQMPAMRAVRWYAAYVAASSVATSG
jgi:hypothetical protein